MNSTIISILHGLVDLVYPPRCWVCSKLGQELVCRDCLNGFDIIGMPFCTRCGKPTEVEVDECRECRGKNFRFSSARAFGLFGGGLKEAVHSFKYKNGKVLAPFFAELILLNIDPQFFEIDLVTEVPLNRKREIRRGFNQAKLLAQSIAKRIDKPHHSLLSQVRETQDQSKLDFRERKKNVRDCFSPNGEGSVLKGKTVLLVDDVFTTGATVNECSKVLLRAGAESVKVVMVARTVLG